MPSSLKADASKVERADDMMTALSTVPDPRATSGVRFFTGRSADSRGLSCAGVLANMHVKNVHGLRVPEVHANSTFHHADMKSWADNVNSKNAD